MIKVEYNADTGLAEVRITGTNTIVKAELTALKTAIVKNDSLAELYIDVTLDMLEATLKKEGEMS